MKIKWKSIYHPYGEWQDENEKSVRINGNFRCNYQGKEVLMVLTNAFSPAGHGEPAIAARVPSFLDSETLKTISVDGFVEVDDALVKQDS